MPTKLVSCSRGKAVLIAVYVETPRKIRLSSNHQQQQQQHDLYIQPTKHAFNGKGPNRRTELLNYSRCLQESAQKSVVFSPQHEQPVSSNNKQMKQIVAVRSTKQRDAGTPTCFGKCTELIPKIRRSLSMSQPSKWREKKKKKAAEFAAFKNLKAVMKTFQVRRKKRFVLAGYRKIFSKRFM